MSFMNWSDRLSVKVKSIDDQHIALVGMVNDLHAAMLKGQARAIAGELLKKLANYTVEHFAYEEKLMASTAYADLATHKGLHEALTKQVMDYIARFEKGDITLSVQLLNFLSDWLVKHIQGEDQKYSPWLISHGVN
jgi:hemerythrin